MVVRHYVDEGREAGDPKVSAEQLADDLRLLRRHPTARLVYSVKDRDYIEMAWVEKKPRRLLAVMYFDRVANGWTPSSAEYCD